MSYINTNHVYFAPRGADERALLSPRDAAINREFTFKGETYVLRASTMASLVAAGTLVGASATLCYALSSFFGASASAAAAIAVTPTQVGPTPPPTEAGRQNGEIHFQGNARDIQVNLAGGRQLVIPANAYVVIRVGNGQQQEAQPVPQNGNG